MGSSFSSSAFADAKTALLLALLIVAVVVRSSIVRPPPREGATSTSTRAAVLTGATWKGFAPVGAAVFWGAEVVGRGMAVVRAGGDAAGVVEGSAAWKAEVSLMGVVDLAGADLTVFAATGTAAGRAGAAVGTNMGDAALMAARGGAAGDEGRETARESASTVSSSSSSFSANMSSIMPPR